jgi:hypothetical protein
MASATTPRVTLIVSLRLKTDDVAAFEAQRERLIARSEAWRGEARGAYAASAGET